MLSSSSILTLASDKPEMQLSAWYAFFIVLTDIMLLVHGCYMIDLYELTDLGNFKLLYLGV